MKKALVCGAGGFIGGHLVRRLKQEGFWVRGVDLKFHDYAETEADDFLIGDLREPSVCRAVVDTRFDEVYQLAADMGGPGSSSPARTTRTSCITPRRSTSMCSMPATSGM